MKRSWRRLSPLSSENVFKTSSRGLAEDQYIRHGHASWRRFQDIFKTSSRRFQDLFNMFCKHVFKTSSICLLDVLKTSWKMKNYYAEDVLKTKKCLLGSDLLKLGANLNKRKKMIFCDQFWKEFCMEFSDFSIKLSCLTLFVVLTFQLLISTQVQGIMQPSIFEKHKICWNCTNSQLNQYYQQKQWGICNGTTFCFFHSSFDNILLKSQ